MASSIKPGPTEDKSGEVTCEPPAIQLGISNSEEKLSARDSYDIRAHIERAGAFSPFRRWVNSLRVKKISPASQPQSYMIGWADTTGASGDNGFGFSPYRESQEPQGERLSGDSSHLGTMKTATMSTASQSVVRSRRNTQSTTNRSIRSDLCGSIDSLRPVLSTTSIDEAALNRALERCQLLEEIVATESDYIFYLKNIPRLVLYISAQPEIYHNVQRIRETHERFLKQIQNATLKASFSKAELDRLRAYGTQKRSRTVDLGLKALQNRSMRAPTFKATMNSRLKELAAVTNAALMVAREIGKLSRSFKHYNDFLRDYKLVIQDVDILRKLVGHITVFEHGIEASTKSAAPIQSRGMYENRSMRCSDLLVKPVQQFAHYPLFLERMLQCTHIQDDPSAHDEIRQVWESVRQVASGIGKSTPDKLSIALVERTFLLEDMLEFSQGGHDVDVYRELGPMTLCGILHVTYQDYRHVTGVYMVCVLFQRHIFLGKMNDECGKIRPAACLCVDDVKIDSLTNGKGFEYYGLFSWKLLFQYKQERFELVLSASSAAEEKQWKTGILKSGATSADAGNRVSSEYREGAFLCLDICPLQPSPCLGPQLSRRPSVVSLVVARTHSDLQHVIIKKTHCPQKHGQAHQSDGEMERFKIPPPFPALIVTARRQDRVRLERAISPIYTKEVLPYPGMFLATGEMLFGSSSIMRHLSLRSKRYSRSSSVNLPTFLRNPSDPQDLDKVDDVYVPHERKKREASESSLGLDHEKAWTLRQDSPVLMSRSKTVKLDRSPKSNSSLNLQSTGKPGKADKIAEYSDTRSLKAIRSVFNSMSLRKSRKHARPSLGGGA